MTRNRHRLLVIKPSALGDVVQSIGVVRAIHAALPNVEIGWLVNRSFAALLRPLPEIAHVHEFDRNAMRGIAGIMNLPRALSSLGNKLQSIGYDSILDLQGLARSGLFSWLSGAPKRLGDRDAREGAPLFYSHSFKVEQRQHAIDRYLELSSKSLGREIRPGFMDMGITPIEFSALAANREIERDSCIVCAPGGRWASKRWPPENYAKVLRELVKFTGCAVVLVGSPDEHEICNFVSELSGVAMLNLAGKTTVRELAVIVAAAKLVLCNDSAVMHMAALQGTPLVALFGPTDPSLTGPWRRDECVVQTPHKVGAHRLYRHVDDEAMRAIPVEAVLRKARQELGL